MRIRANLDTGIETFSWVVTAGSGDYASLRGSGAGAIVLRLGGSTNTSAGRLH